MQKQTLNASVIQPPPLAHPAPGGNKATTKALSSLDAASRVYRCVPNVPVDTRRRRLKLSPWKDLTSSDYYRWEKRNEAEFQFETNPYVKVNETKDFIQSKTIALASLPRKPATAYADSRQQSWPTPPPAGNNTAVMRRLSELSVQQQVRISELYSVYGGMGMTSVSKMRHLKEPPKATALPKLMLKQQLLRRKQLHQHKHGQNPHQTVLPKLSPTDGNSCTSLVGSSAKESQNDASKYDRKKKIRVSLPKV